MNDPVHVDTPEPYVQLPFTQLAKIAVVGAMVGLIIWGLSYLLDMYVLQALMCRDAGVNGCNETMKYAEIVASIVGVAFGLFALLRLQVFRPLLVALAATISLWGMIGMLQPLPLYIAAVCSILLYLFAYVCFAWISRIRVFLIVALLFLVAIVAIRLILNS